MSETTCSASPRWLSEAATRAVTTLLRTENSAMPRPWTPQLSVTIVSSLLVTRGSKMRVVQVLGARPVPSSTTVMTRRSPSRCVATKMRVAWASRRVAQQLDDDVLEGADVVLGLPALGLGDAQTDEALAEVLLDLEVGLARDGLDEIEEGVACRS